MGQTTRPGTEIIDFYPDDGENHFYIQASFIDICLTEIIEKAKEKWGEITVEQISITPEHIHTRCIYYDLHCSGDWDDFLKITRTV